MQLFVFKDFLLQTILFEYASFQFRRCFRGAGEFTLTLNGLDEIDNLIEGNIILAQDDAYLIENTHSFSNMKGEKTLEITGRHINCLLERRVQETTAINTTDAIEVQLMALIDANFIHPIIPARKAAEISNKPVKGIDTKATTAYTLNKMALLELCNRICGNSGLGYRLNYLPEERTIQFEVLQGRDLKDQVFFSEEYANVSEADIYKQSNEYRNVLCKDGTFTGDAAGLERREVMIDDTQNLSDFQRLISVDGAILNTDQFQYRGDWDLGDTVTFIDRTLGFYVENPVLEIVETHGSDKDIDVTFGKRVPTVFEKLKKG